MANFGLNDVKVCVTNKNYAPLKQYNSYYIFPNSGTITLPASGSYLLGVPAAYNSVSFNSVFKGICTTSGASETGFSMYTASNYSAGVYSFTQSTSTKSNTRTITMHAPYSGVRVKSVLLSCRCTSSSFVTAAVTNASISGSTITIQYDIIPATSVTVDGLVYVGW